MTDEEDFIRERLAAAKARLLAVDSAITQVLGGAQMYSLDSGQTRQTVQKASLGQLQKMKEAEEANIVNFQRRLACTAATVGSPGW